jgi:hypothetical protein
MTEGGELNRNDPWRSFAASGALPQNSSASDIAAENS